MDGAFSLGDTTDALKLPRISLRPIDLSLATERLVECWHDLKRSSVDAAILPPSENNIFAFADMCIFMATIHDLDTMENDAKKREKVPAANAPPFEDRLLSTFRFRNETVRSSANAGTTTGKQLRWTEYSERESSFRDGQQDQASSSSRAHEHTSDVPPYYDVVAPNNRWTMPPSISTPNTRDYASDNGCDQRDDMAGFTLSDDPSLPDDSELKSPDLVGIAYLYPATGAAASACEASLGVSLLPHARGKGLGTETVRRLLGLAFEEFKFHRVSAGVIGPIIDRPSPRGTSTLSGTLAETETTLRMLVGLGFVVEGTRRRAVPGMEDNGSWRDVYYLAMLDTDWLVTPLGQPWLSGSSSDNRTRAYSSLQNRRTRWDEMLARHQMERETLLSAESRLKRSASMETLRPDGIISSNRADVEISLAPSSVSVSSSAASEYMSDRGVEHGQRQAVALSSVQSLTFSLSNPFRDPTTFIPGGLQLLSSSRSTSENANIREGNDLLNDFDASAVHGKVARYLLAHPAPGPPPSEPGSSLDSEADSASEFESCADPDDLDFLGDVKDKGKAKAISQGRQNHKEISLFFARDGNSSVSYSPSPDAHAIVEQDEHSGESSEQVRKKRRLSSDLGEEVGTTSNPNLTGLTTPQLHTSTLNLLCLSSPSFSSGPSRLASGSVEQGAPLYSTPLPYRNLSENSYSHSHSEVESVSSDAETNSTAASSWGVVSSAGDLHRSPSPTLSLLSGTGSPSLQSASEDQDE